MADCTETSPFDWDELFLAMEDRELIPVLGQELLIVDGEGTTLEEVWSGAVASDLGFELAEPDRTLNGLAVRYMQGAGSKAETRKRKLLKAVHGVATSSAIPIPEPLLQLAEISQLSTFLTTTFDGMMLRALREVRGEGAGRPLSYHIEAIPDDLPHTRTAADAVVYHLFGSVDTRTDFAVTEEDVIERLHQLQNPQKQPELLFDELADKHLLFLGCRFPDGVARVLMRTLTNERLFAQGRRSKLVGRAEPNPDLRLFLTHCGSEWYADGDATSFVSDLVCRWRDSELARETEEQQSSRGDSRAVSAGVFISYKSQDLERVQPIAAALTSARIPIWFDKKDIEGGEDWSAEIEKGLKHCTLFMPVLSTNSQVGESVVIREWNRALARKENIAEDTPFIVPVLLDQLEDFERDESGDILRIPDHFFTKQAIVLGANGPDDSFTRTVKDRMKDAQLAGVGR